MRNRVSQRYDVHNGKEALLKVRGAQGDCTLCPPNHCDNHHGHHSNWGRKVAPRRKYTTGKGRREVDWLNHPYWDLTDKHYEEEK